MNKLREQIAVIISDWDRKPESLRASWGTLIPADAILALLQPRMLTKDEARCVDCKAVCTGCSAEGSLVACDETSESATAKLKLIQEEE